jgi:hypothetical protein
MLRTGSTEAVLGRRARPVLWWAAIGVLFLILQIKIFGAWILSDQFARVGPGPDETPVYMLFFVRFWETAGWLVAGWGVWRYLIKPWRARGLTMDACFVIGVMSTIWQDPLINWFEPYYAYNQNFINMGTWARHIPGWIAPNIDTHAEPIVWILPMCIWWILLPMVLGCYLLRKAKARWPEMGTMGALVGCLTGGMLLSLVTEILIANLPGLYVYPGAAWLTLFRGHYFQFPLHEMVIGGVWWGTLIFMRWYVNDKGETLCDSGLDRVKGSVQKKTSLRLLGFVGLLNVQTLLMFCIPAAIVGAYAHDWPEDITSRSYLEGGQTCGPGARYACPSTDVPIARINSIYFDGDRNLVVPECVDAALAEEVATDDNPHTLSKPC